MLETPAGQSPRFRQVEGFSALSIAGGFLARPAGCWKGGKAAPSPRSRNDPAPSRRPQGGSQKAKEKGHPPGCPSLDLAIPAISVSPCQTFSGSALKHEIPVFISFVNLDVDSAQILFCADADLAAEVVVSARDNIGVARRGHIVLPDELDIGIRHAHRLEEMLHQFRLLRMFLSTLAPEKSICCSGLVRDATTSELAISMAWQLG